MLKPNFFIVGAPKSGTTALYEYLKQHPDVFFDVKEICYFCPDLTLRTPHITESVYLSYYTNAGNQQAVGDGYVYHLLSKEAAKEIKAFNPDARIIIMLRNPVEMVYSLHAQHVFDGDELIENFEDALNAQSSKSLAERVPDYYKCPLESMDYSSVAKYYEQVLRYKSVFAEDKVHIILYDDFKLNPEQEYRKLLKFLGLKETMPNTFEVINPSHGVRSKSFRNFLINAPGGIKAMGRVFFPHHSKRRVWLMHKLWFLNSKSKTQKPLTEELKQRLVDMYKNDIQKLEKLLNRDLGNWLKV